MPNATNLTLAAADITDATVDEVYNVVDRREGNTTFRHVGTGPISLASRIAVTVKQPTAQSRYGKVTIYITKPESYTDADTGIVGQHFADYATLEFKIDKRANQAQIVGFAERTLAILGLAEIQQVITNLESFY